MDLTEYLRLMNFSDQWKSLEMIPDEEYMEGLIDSYKPGMEDASEHDRNGCFHYWLKRNPSEKTLINLSKLTLVDPDSPLSEDVQSYIRKSANYSAKVERVLNGL